MLTLLAGALDFFLLDEEGRIVARRELNASSPLIQIEPKVWHSCVIKEADTIALEVKPGPYRPNEFAPWAPEEGTFNSEKMLLRMQRGRIGDLLRVED